MSKGIDNGGVQDTRDLRELRLEVPDARLPSVRRRVAVASAKLAPDAELDAMSWIEAVSDFDTGADTAER